MGLGAPAAQHVIKKVTDAYTVLWANLRNGRYGKPGPWRYQKATPKPTTFRSDAAQPYDQRNLSFALDMRTVSLWTTFGRLTDIPFLAAPRALALLAPCRRGEADLLRRDGMWLLLVTVEVPEAPLNQTPAGLVGVDLGVVNIATTSTGRRGMPGVGRSGTAPDSKPCGPSSAQADQERSAAAEAAASPASAGLLVMSTMHAAHLGLPPARAVHL